MYFEYFGSILKVFWRFLKVFGTILKIFWCFYYDLYAYYITINSYPLLFLGYLLSILLKTMILSIEIDTFRHISKTVKPKNDFLFLFDRSCDFEHINIDPESIWIQNAVCRRIRSFWLVILFRVLGGDLCKKEEHFYVLESSIVIVGLSRNRTPFTFVDHLDVFFINWPNIRKMI